MKGDEQTYSMMQGDTLQLGWRADDGKTTKLAVIKVNIRPAFLRPFVACEISVMEDEEIADSAGEA